MNNSERNALDCAIVGDLLSLYHDDVVSETTKTAVEAHLAGCEGCRREYDALSRELPIDAGEKSTGKRFASLMRWQKIKKVLCVVLPVLLAFVILTVGYVVQLHHPIVNMNEDISIPQVIRYETEEGTKFFFVSVHPMYEGALSGSAHTEYTENGALLQLDFDRTILVTTLGDEPVIDVFVYEFNGLPGVAPSCDEITEVRLGDRVIWSEAEDGDDPVPAYVYVHDRFGEDDSILTWDVDYHADDPSRSTMTVEYIDGRTIVWDFEGNVISESTANPSASHSDL